VRATPEDTPEHAARLAILLKAVSHFITTYLSDIDIHSLVASYEHEARKKVLSAFYVAYAVLVEHAVEGTPKLATPSLLAEALSGRASIFAIFGGQGINEIYFDELQMLFDTYRPFVEPFLTSAVDEVLQPLASASQGTSFYKHGMSVGVATLPSVAYFASVPVSFPPI
jgi:fatty acid synthase subunit alpha, fungi type